MERAITAGGKCANVGARETVPGYSQFRGSNNSPKQGNSFKSGKCNVHDNSSLILFVDGVNGTIDKECGWVGGCGGMCMWRKAQITVINFTCFALNVSDSCFIHKHQLTATVHQQSISTHMTSPTNKLRQIQSECTCDISPNLTNSYITLHRCSLTTTCQVFTVNQPSSCRMNAESRQNGTGLIQPYSHMNSWSLKVTILFTHTCLSTI